MRFNIKFQNGSVQNCTGETTVAALDAWQREHGAIKSIDKNVAPREPRVISVDRLIN